MGTATRRSHSRGEGWVYNEALANYGQACNVHVTFTGFCATNTIDVQAEPTDYLFYGALCTLLHLTRELVYLTSMLTLLQYHWWLPRPHRV